MKRIPVLLLSLMLTAYHVFPQSKADSLTDDLKAKMFNNPKYFTFGFYMDAYLNMELDKNTDTSNVVPFSANCPVRDQFRLNLAAIEMYYTAEKVRGKLVLQWGDAPNLLAAPDMQFIKTIRQANFGFRIVKDLWIDIGYIFNPIGFESMWPVLNDISTATICGYFEPGSVIGAKLSYKFSDKLNGGIMAGNPFSLAYQQYNRFAGIIFINYIPFKKLAVTYNNIFGNQALRTSQIKDNLLYNEIIIAYDPLLNFRLVGQIDFAFQINSQMPPDTNKIASMTSGFLLAKYSFLHHFSVAARYEFYYDPDGFLSGLYTYDGRTTGLTTNGLAISVEYKPVKIGYLRMEYKYIHANKGNEVFYGNTSDLIHAIIFTTGVRF